MNDLSIVDLLHIGKVFYTEGFLLLDVYFLGVLHEFVQYTISVTIRYNASVTKTIIISKTITQLELLCSSSEGGNRKSWPSDNFINSLILF